VPKILSLKPSQDSLWNIKKINVKLCSLLLTCFVHCPRRYMIFFGNDNILGLIYVPQKIAPIYFNLGGGTEKISYFLENLKRAF
jgi:hypothetical protein